MSCALGALKSDLGETVLRDFDGAAGSLASLPGRSLICGDGETGVARNDDGTCARKRIVQGGDELAFFRSFHCCLSI